MRPMRTTSVTPAPCDCCGAQAWRYAFSENGVDLGRCEACGLYYIAQMPPRERRMTEIEAGHFSGDQQVASAELQFHAETIRQPEFQAYVDLARRLAPPGKWLEIGCGTGVLMATAKRGGVEVEGIELTVDRRAVARQIVGATVYDQPLETLKLPPESFAAVILINVFSHLISPTETLAHIRRLLVRGGIVLLETGEIGPGVQRRHAFSWSLGDHLYFLGIGTLERYAQKLDFQVAHRQQVWFPATVYTRMRFTMRGRSRLRNLVKRMILSTPGALPMLRWYMLTRREVGNPVYASTLVLRKTNGVVWR